MGFFRKREQTESADSVLPEPQIDDVLLKALLDGETITRGKAMTLPAVNSAVDFISSSIACMPVRLFKVTDGKVSELTNDPRTRLLNGDTEDTLDGYQLKKAAIEDYLLGKGGYIYINRKGNHVRGLFYVEEKNITIFKNTDPIFKYFEIQVNGKSYDSYDFIKVLRNTKDGASGTGLVVEVSKALESAYQTLKYQLNLVQTGGNKRGFVKSQRKLGKEEIETLKNAWKAMYANNSENVVILNNGLDFQEASNSSVEMQLNESKTTLRDEINSIFHVYPADFGRTFKEAIFPVVKAFETALNRDLLLEKEKGSCYFSFDTKEIVKASIQERYNAYKTAKETGFLTVNEIRKAEDLNFIEGLDVINVGLSAVLYDTNKQQYFVPNTGMQTGGEDNAGEIS